GDPVEAMDGHEVRQIEVDAQTGDDAFADEPAVGGAGEEMGLVDDEQVLVLEHDADLGADPLLGRDRTMEEVEAAGDDRIIPGPPRSAERLRPAGCAARQDSPRGMRIRATSLSSRERAGGSSHGWPARRGRAVRWPRCLLEAEADCEACPQSTALRRAGFFPRLRAPPSSRDTRAAETTPRPVSPYAGGHGPHRIDGDIFQ